MQTNLYLSFCKVAKIASFHVDAKIPELMCFNLAVKNAYLNLVFRRILMENSTGGSWFFTGSISRNSAQMCLRTPQKFLKMIIAEVIRN